MFILNILWKLKQPKSHQDKTGKESDTEVIHGEEQKEQKFSTIKSEDPSSLVEDKSVEDKHSIGIELNPFHDDTNTEKAIKTKNQSNTNIIKTSQAGNETITPAPKKVKVKSLPLATRRSTRGSARAAQVLFVQLCRKIWINYFIFVKNLLVVVMSGKTGSNILLQAAPGEELKGNISKPTYTKGQAKQTENKEIEDSADEDKEKDSITELRPDKPLVCGADSMTTLDHKTSDTKDERQVFESSFPNLELVSDSIPNHLEAHTLATSATLELAKFFALQNLRGDCSVNSDEDQNGWKPDEGAGGLEGDEGNLEGDADFSLNNFGGMSPAKEEDFLVKEKKAAIPKKTLSQREPESVNMEINAFLDTSVDDLLKGLSDEEEKHEEALYDLDDDWQHWDDNSPTDDSENIPTADTSPQQNQCTDNVDVIDENIAVSENLDDIVVSRSDDKLSIGSLNNAPTSEAMLREVMSNQMTIEYNLDETTDEEMLTEISAKMTKELLDLFGTEMEEEEENTNNTRPEINLEEKAAAAIKRKRLLPT